MNDIRIIYPDWYSLKKLALYVADEFKRIGFCVSTMKYNVNAVKYAQEPILHITGGLKEYPFMRLCSTYHKKGALWVDILEDKPPIGYLNYQRRFRENGGKFICTTKLEHDRLTDHGLIVDAVVPRCVPDKVFDYNWQGTKQSVISVGNPDVRKEAILFKWANLPVEFKKASRKGHEYLVKFAEKNPDWHVRLISHLDQLKKICDKVDFPNLEIVETGTLTDEQVYSYMANSGVYCHPCRVEPFGLVIAEAEAIGVPTCYTNLPQQGDIGGGVLIPFIENYRFLSGVTLATIDYEEVEKAIFKTYAMSNELSPICRQNAQRFRVSVIVQKLKEVIGI